MGGWSGGISNLFPEHNSATVRNILMIPGRIIEEVSVVCRILYLSGY